MKLLNRNGFNICCNAYVNDIFVQFLAHWHSLFKDFYFLTGSGVLNLSFMRIFTFGVWIKLLFFFLTFIEWKFFLWHINWYNFNFSSSRQPLKHCVGILDIFEDFWNNYNFLHVQKNFNFWKSLKFLEFLFTTI